ncbi:MAG: OmpA family protein, partial [Proteobacteria bacterium]|nr:OmpA family protein [Pseudomonadota bacterium]
MRKNYLLVGGAMLVLAGCTNLDVKSVEMMAPKGGDFNAALQKEYVALAKMEAAEFDWPDVSLFNGKAAAAANGEKVGPQNINDRRLPKDAIPGLSVARSSLVKALESGGPAKAPQHAARAQAMFDCWMQ